MRRAASGKTGVAHALVEWSSDPLTDMIADAVLSVILQLAEEPAGLAEAEKAHKNALEAKDKDGAANARLRIVAAMLGVQFGEPDVDEPTQTLRLRVLRVHRVGRGRGRKGRRNRKGRRSRT